MNYEAVYRTATATLGLLTTWTRTENNWNYPGQSVSSYQTTWTRTENNRNYAPGNQGFSSIIPSQQFYDGQYLPNNT